MYFRLLYQQNRSLLTNYILDWILQKENNIFGLQSDLLIITRIKTLDSMTVLQIHKYTLGTYTAHWHSRWGEIFKPRNSGRPVFALNPAQTGYMFVFRYTPPNMPMMKEVFIQYMRITPQLIRPTVDLSISMLSSHSCQRFQLVSYSNRLHLPQKWNKSESEFISKCCWYNYCKIIIQSNLVWFRVFITLISEFYLLRQIL